MPLFHKATKELLSRSPINGTNMVDEVITAPVQVATTESAAPVAPIADTIPLADSTTTAPSVPTETAGASPDPVKTEDVPKAETLLGEKRSEEKPIEAKVEGKPVEVKIEDAPIEPAKYEFTLPEGVKVDDAKFGEFTKMLGDFETTAKVPHDELQKLGQQMVDRHIQEMQRYTQTITEAWDKQKSDWKDSFLKDPEFSNRTDTVVNSAVDAIRTFGGDSKQQDEFHDLMNTSGVGNHPAMIRLLSNVMLAKAEGKPLAAPQIATPMKQSKMSKMYGTKTGS